MPHVLLRVHCTSAVRARRARGLSRVRALRARCEKRCRQLSCHLTPCLGARLGTVRSASPVSGGLWCSFDPTSCRHCFATACRHRTLYRRTHGWPVIVVWAACNSGMGHPFGRCTAAHTPRPPPCALVGRVGRRTRVACMLQSTSELPHTRRTCACRASRSAAWGLRDRLGWPVIVVWAACNSGVGCL